MSAIAGWIISSTGGSIISPFKSLMDSATPKWKVNISGAKAPSTPVSGNTGYAFFGPGSAFSIVVGSLLVR